MNRLALVQRASLSPRGEPSEARAGVGLASPRRDIQLSGKGDQMICSEARLNANRQNAKRSTGPRTTEGRSRSSRNALKHGFCASGCSLTPLEDREAYERYTASIRDSLHPASAIEEELAQRIADLSWRLRRIPDAEAALLARDTRDDLMLKCARERDEKRHEQEDPQQDQEQEDRDDQGILLESAAHLLAAAMSLPQNTYLTLQRYESSLDRARSRSLKELRQLQKDRRDHPVESAADAEVAPRPNEPTAPGEPATPSTLEGEGRGDGEAATDDPCPLPNEPKAPSASSVCSAAEPQLAELPNEPTAPSQIADPGSQIDRPLTVFHLKPSDLRPVQLTPSRRAAAPTYGPATPGAPARDPSCDRP